MKRWFITLLIAIMLINGCSTSKSSSLIESSKSSSENFSTESSSEESSSEILTEQATTEEITTEEATTEEITTEEATTEEITTEEITTEEATTEEITTEEATTEIVTLISQKIPVGTLGNTWQIPNEVIEEMQSPEIYILENSLILHMVSMNDDGCEDIFKSVSMGDGSLLGEITLKASGFMTVQLSEDRIGICDSGLGQVIILDRMLQLETIYQLEADWQDWYLSSDLQTLYQFDTMNGITARALHENDATYSEKNVILDNVANVYLKKKNKDSVVFSYVQKDTQKTASRNLNLKTGMIENVPVLGDVAGGTYANGTWFIQDAANWGEYYVIKNGERKIAFWEENRFDLLEPLGHLLALTGDGRTLNLYEVDGSFISKCQFLDGEDCFIGHEILWSDLWNGYIFLQYGSDMKPKLMFWDIYSASEIEEDFSFRTEEQSGGSSAESYLYERAEEMEKSYGVEILIADECQLEYNTFSSWAVNDTESIENALSVLEEALSQYPEGFFEQLCYGNIRHIQIELVGGLVVNNPEEYTGSYAAFASNETDHYLMVFDSYLLYAGTLFHEVAHIIDARLTWDSDIREDALFSEEAWLALQPEGFTFPNTYGELTEETLNFANSGYFVMDYSCRYPTEDRATMMEVAMSDGGYTFTQNPKLYDKLEFYSDCIRDCFDTTGWPDIVKWEELISY